MKNIGINLTKPDRDCSDRNCPFHGNVSIRGKLIHAKLVSSKAKYTAVVQREYFHYVKKYMRYEKRRSRIIAHMPPCLDINDEEDVVVGECRPLTKHISFIILGKVNN